MTILTADNQCNVLLVLVWTSSKCAPSYHIKVIVVHWHVMILDGIKSRLLECCIQCWEFQGSRIRAEWVWCVTCLPFYEQFQMHMQHGGVRKHSPRGLVMNILSILKSNDFKDKPHACYCYFLKSVSAFQGMGNSKYNILESRTDIY